MVLMDGIPRPVLRLESQDEGMCKSERRVSVQKKRASPNKKLCISKI